MPDDPQLSLPFDTFEDPIVQLMSADEIFHKLDADTLGRFAEDRRVEFKPCGIHLQTLSEYYSMFSNTGPAGGVILLGVGNDGDPTGCKELSTEQLNKLESFHTQFVPAAQPTHRRIPCLVEGKADFFVAVYIPYLNKLTENNRGEAFIRYGEREEVRKSVREDRATEKAESVG